MSEKIYREISELKEGARTACAFFMDAARAAGLTDIFITETYRTQARQNELYSQGRTAPGNIVTWTKTSRHTSRRAWDICFHNTLYADTAKFEEAGKIAAALGITWGGTWKNKDLPHFEYLEGEYMLPTAKKEAEDLSAWAKSAGIITDAELWYKYLTGEKAITPGNLRALFAKIKNKMK